MLKHRSRGTLKRVGESSSLLTLLLAIHPAFIGRYDTRLVQLNQRHKLGNPSNKKAGVNMRLQIGVCTSKNDACERSGSRAWLTALQAFTKDDVDVVRSPCLSRCMQDKVWTTVGGLPGQVSPELRYLTAAKSSEKLLESVRDLLNDLGIASWFVPAYQLKLDADAILPGDLAGAASMYTDALKLAEENWGSSMWDPTQEPLEDDTACWESSEWWESIYDQRLVFDTEAGFATSPLTGNQLALENCVVGDTQDDYSVPLTGTWRHSNGESGTFDLLLDSTGKSFTGTLTEDNGDAWEWSGETADTTPAAPLAKDPPAHKKWIYDAIVGRGKCRLEGSPASALQDADAAVALACRALAAWELKLQALEALGDLDGVETVKKMLVRLRR